MSHFIIIVYRCNVIKTIVCSICFLVDPVRPFLGKSLGRSLSASQSLIQSFPLCVGQPTFKNPLDETAEKNSVVVSNQLVA